MGVDASLSAGLITGSLVKSSRAVRNLRGRTRANRLRGHAVDELIRYRAMQAFCLQRARMEHEDEMFWEAEAEVWARRAAHVDIKISGDESASPGNCDTWVSSPSTAVSGDDGRTTNSI
jgi:hypothetical protein